jgi:hypothetical protein
MSKYRFAKNLFLVIYLMQLPRTVVNRFFLSNFHFYSFLEAKKWVIFVSKFFSGGMHFGFCLIHIFSSLIIDSFLNFYLD